MTDRLTEAINQQIDLRSSLSHNLNMLDRIVKQMSIDPASVIALQAYQFICRQYLTVKTPTNSSKQPNSPEQSSAEADVNDPEMFALFSFAKNRKTSVNKPAHTLKAANLFKEDRVQPEPNQRSQKINSKKLYRMEQKNYVSSFNLFQNQQLADQHGKGVDIKEKSRVKLKQTEQKQAQLLQTRKRKSLIEMIAMIKRQKEVIRKQLRGRAAQYLSATHIYIKIFRVLKQQAEQMKKIAAKANQFRSLREEQVIEEYFLAWKERAMMSEAERQFQTEVQQKYKLLCHLNLIRKIKKYHQLIHSRQQFLEENTKQLNANLQQSRKRIFMKRLEIVYQKNYEFNGKRNQLKKTTLKREMVILLQLITRNTVVQTDKQRQKIQSFLKLTKGRKLINKLRDDQEISQVYWRQKQKIVFLKMFFEAIRQSLRRKGYEEEWMEELSISLKRTDKKLGNYAHKYELSRLFQGLRQVLHEERQKTETVKMIHGERILKHLIHNFKISIIKQKEEYQIQQLTQRTQRNIIIKSLSQFRQNTNYLSSKSAMVFHMIKESRANTVFQYLKAHRLAANYYYQQIAAFQQRQSLNLLRKVYQAFKKVTLTQIINSRIIHEYRAYQARIKIEAIFACLKEHTYQQKLVKRRLANLVKLRTAYFFEHLSFNMRVSLYGKQKLKDKQFKKNSLKLTNNVKKKAVQSIVRVHRKKKLKQIINISIGKQYNLRLSWKMFNIMKIVCLREAKQKQIGQQIRKKQEARRKQAVFDGMIHALLSSLIFKKIDQMAIKLKLRLSFQKIISFNKSKISNKGSQIYQNQSKIKSDSNEESQNIDIE